MPEIGGTRKNKDNIYTWYACADCGKERWVKFVKGKPVSSRCHQCAGKLVGIAERGANNPFWKGGRRKNSKGYIEVLLQPDDFFFQMKDKRGYVLEHRLVMAKKLGRCLAPWELVHHKDGIKDHNVKENLDMTTSGSHIIEHNKGYRDGYRQGFIDGQSREIQELKQQIKLLQWHINELEGSPCVK